jgi:hypothetical protein
MTRYALIVGVILAALFTLIWFVFNVLPALPNTGFAPFDSILHTLRIFAAINGYNDRTPFTGSGPVFKLWFVCLLIAVVSDRVIKPPARAVVSAFAAALSPEVGQVACEVQQDVGWRAIIQTTTSGSFRGLRTTVLIYQRPNLSYLTLEMACRTSLAFDIRKRNLLGQALAFVGAPVETEDKALDEVVVIQGDDEVAIRRWVQASGVRSRILSLFQLYEITSLTAVTDSEGGPMVQAYYARFRPRLFSTEHAVGILNDVAELAATAEAALFGLS